MKNGYTKDFPNECLLGLVQTAIIALFLFNS